MTQINNYKIFDETEQLILGHVFEDVYLTIKSTGEKINLGNFNGDPTCGLISKTNNWCIVGGSVLIIWTKEEIIEITDNDLNWVSNIRLKGENKVELLVDPWAKNSAIWEYDILTKHKFKIKDFPNYKDKEYTDNLDW